MKAESFDHYIILGHSIHAGDKVEYRHGGSGTLMGTVNAIRRCPSDEQCSDSVCKSKIYLEFSDTNRIPCVKHNFDLVQVLTPTDNIINKVVIV